MNGMNLDRWVSAIPSGRSATSASADPAAERRDDPDPRDDALPVDGMVPSVGSGMEAPSTLDEPLVVAVRTNGVSLR